MRVPNGSPLAVLSSSQDPGSSLACISTFLSHDSLISYRDRAETVHYKSWPEITHIATALVVRNLDRRP